MSDAKMRDPRQDPRKGDQLREENGRLMTVDGVHPLRTNPKARQVSYTAVPGGHGCVCGLSDWRRYYKRAEILHVAEDERTSSHPASVAVPEGWKLVPITVTDRIMTAMSRNGVPDGTDADELWDAMLAAAPHPVSGEQKQAYPVIRHVRPHSHKCANVQINATSDTACDCGAVVNGVAVEVAPAAQDVAGLVSAAQRVLDGLNARIDHAVMIRGATPVFDGIADLHSALAAHRAQQAKP